MSTHTVREENGRAANMPISWLIVHGAVVRFSKADLRICLHFPWEGVETLYDVQNDTQQPIDSILARQ